MLKLYFLGKMFPTRGDLHVAPFTDEALYMEQFNKVRLKEIMIFWKNNNMKKDFLCPPQFHFISFKKQMKFMMNIFFVNQFVKNK